MPRFDINSITAIEYDFSGWKIQDAGVVPEPSKRLVKDTMKRVAKAFEAAGMDDVDESVAGVTNALQKVSDEELFERIESELTDALSDLCDGSPSRESLEALPWRPFMAFFGYVMGEITSPEVSRPDTSPTPNLRRGR